MRSNNKHLDESGEDEDHSSDKSSNNAKPYVCTVCSRSFISQIALQNHLWSHLPRGKLIDSKSVRRNHKVYSANGVLHANTDNGTGVYVCPVCGKRLSTNGNLKVHIETHRPKGQYGCDICGRM